ncbi:sensor histidine kinase [Actinoplanes sp. RD1]|uniref:sensor histidine kinase n=1 Tax=Actinoplanes sp. RD1 TaxID=3064538 RepID=UPI00274296CD|nr:HAMP domain-containing sensor histidine kinase [Actinoplanes sp. RD1]
MIRSIRGRLTLVLVLLLAAGLLLVAVASVVLVRRYLAERVEAGLVAGATRVSAALAGRSEYELTAEQLALLLPKDGTALLVDRAGRVQLSAGAPVPAQDRLAGAAAGLTPGRVREVDGPDPVVVTRIPTPGLTVALQTGDKIRAEAVVVAVPTDDDRGTVRLLTAVNLIGAAVALVLMGVLASVLTRVGLRPLTRMARTADAIAAGERELRLPASPAGPETAALAAAVNNAFDAQNRAFDARRRAEDRLRSFVADASHELRTPLATVHGWVDLYVQGGLRDPDQLDHAMERVAAEVGRMRLLVDELALLARLDAARPLDRAPVDVVALAAEVVDDARVVSSDRVITLEGAGPAVVDGDGPRIQQVLRNLVGNAVQHTTPGTPVTVVVGHDGTATTITVRDQGDGIAPEHLPHVFERFYRADPSRSRDGGGSSGLGLAIVEAIVTAHGGTATVSSVPGEGTTVRVTFPPPR